MRRRQGFSIVLGDYENLGDKEFHRKIFSRRVKMVMRRDKVTESELKTDD